MKKLALIVIIIALATAAWLFYKDQNKTQTLGQRAASITKADITTIVLTDAGNIRAVKKIVDESYKDAAQPDTNMSFIYVTVDAGIVTEINNLITSQGANVIISDAAYSNMIRPFAAQNDILIAEIENDNDLMEVVFVLTNAYNTIKSQIQTSPTINEISNYIASTFVPAEANKEE